MNIFRKLFQRKAAPKIGTLLFPNWLNETARWLLLNQQSFVDEGFNLNPVVFSAIMYKARAASRVPLVAYGGTRQQPERLPADHPLQRFCARPNPWMSFAEMQMVNELFYNLFGNAYVALVKQRDGSVEAWPLRPDYVTHLYARRELIGYEYHPGGYPGADTLRLLAQDVLHVKIPNPGDDFAGMGPGLSPLFPAARAVDVDNAVTEYLKIFFQRGAMPQALITTEQPLDDNTAQMLKERFVATYGNYNNWTDPLVLGAGATISRVGSTFADLDVSGLDRRNEARATMVFGVPLTLIESAPDIVQSTYSNKETDRRMFWEDTMTAELSAFEVEWTYYLRNDAGEFVLYDYSQVPALQESQALRAEALRAGFEAGAVTQNEYRAALELPPLPNGDAIKLSPTAYLIPTSATPPAADEQGAASAEDEGEKKMIAPDTKAALYRKQDAVSRRAEPGLSTAARQALETDRRNLLALTREARLKALERKATVDWQMTFDEYENYLNGESQEQWRAKFDPLLAQLVTTQQRQLSAEFGREFTVRNIRAEEWFQNYSMTFADEIAETSKDEIAQLIDQALREGWSVEMMSEQLEILFNQWIDGGQDNAAFALERLPQPRRELIARDQSVRASNAGTYQLYTDWNVAQKEWYSTADDRTRDAHRIGVAWGQPPLVVGINEKFTVGNSRLEFPGDPAGEPQDVIQCRCTLLPVIPD